MPTSFLTTEYSIKSYIEQVLSNHFSLHRGIFKLMTLLKINVFRPSTEILYLRGRLSFPRKYTWIVDLGCFWRTPFGVWSLQPLVQIWTFGHFLFSARFPPVIWFRRRSLYPTELRRHFSGSCIDSFPKNYCTLFSFKYQVFIFFRLYSQRLSIKAMISSFACILSSQSILLMLKTWRSSLDWFS